MRQLRFFMAVLQSGNDFDSESDIAIGLVKFEQQSYILNSYWNFLIYLRLAVSAANEPMITEHRFRQGCSDQTLHRRFLLSSAQDRRMPGPPTDADVSHGNDGADSDSGKTLPEHLVAYVSYLGSKLHRIETYRHELHSTQV